MSEILSSLQITFVNYITGDQFVALESCGKCKVHQGGATTFTAGALQGFAWDFRYA